MNFFKKIANGLKKTRDNLANALAKIFPSSEIDEEFYEELEFLLISADIGANTSVEIIDKLKKVIKANKLKKVEEVKDALRNIISEMIHTESEEIPNPKLVMVVGVNGVGKTTTIGKLAAHNIEKKNKVMMVAGDTFRAGASEQLTVWAERNNCKIIKNKEGSDSASVVFDGIKSAISKNIDVLLVDTAGRLHNKTNLMEELKKIGRIVEKEWQGELEKILVVDATTGQNAIQQVKLFDEAVGLDGIIMTKLDGTSKGGILINIVHELNMPVRFIGVGEGIDDLMPFDSEEFAKSII